MINQRKLLLQDKELQEYLQTKKLNLTATTNGEDGALYDDLYPSRIIVGEHKEDKETFDKTV